VDSRGTVPAGLRFGAGAARRGAADDPNPETRHDPHPHVSLDHLALATPLFLLAACGGGGGNAPPVQTEFGLGMETGSFAEFYWFLGTYLVDEPANSSRTPSRATTSSTSSIAPRSTTGRGDAIRSGWCYAPRSALR
jgi:hypothetical protein